MKYFPTVAASSMAIQPFPVEHHLLVLFGSTVRSHRLHLLPVRAAVCLGPLGFTRITLHFEVFVALGSAEGKYLQVEAKGEG